MQGVEENTRSAKLRDLLFVVNSFDDGRYARYEYLQLHQSTWTIDVIFLNEELTFSIGPEILVRQRTKIYNFSAYKLIVFWPSSYQYSKARFGSFFYDFNKDEFIERAWHVAEAALFFGLDDRMINPYQASLLAANKAVLLKAAKDLNIQMPRMVISNDDLELKRVAIIKPLVKTITDTNEINEEDRSFPVRLDGIPEAELVRPQPVMVQEEIKSKVEFRVYCFDGNTIVVRIPRPEGNLVDIRLNEGKFLGCSIEFDSELVEIAERLSCQFGLRMCSIDFIQSESGLRYLLDLNPHGSWHWLEPSVSRTIDQAFESMIARRLGHFAI